MISMAHFRASSLKLVPGVSQAAVIEQLDRLLERYGGLGAFGRKDQISHAFLDAELQQLESMSRMLPPIFLVVAAFLVNMTLSRLIALEREQIGLLKAMGYSSGAVARHYLGFVSMIAVIGIVIGFVAGSWLGVGMTTALCQVLQLPVPGVQPQSGGLCDRRGRHLCVGGDRRPEGGARCCVAAAGRRHVAAGAAALSQDAAAASTFHGIVRQSSVIVMRHLTHWPWRTASGILGMALAVAILVGSLWSFGSIDHMIDVTFHRSDRQDASINFTEPRRIAALFEARRLPGVIARRTLSRRACETAQRPCGAPHAAGRQAAQAPSFRASLSADLKPVVSAGGGLGDLAGRCRHSGPPDAATWSKSRSSKAGARQ